MAKLSKSELFPLGQETGKAAGKWQLGSPLYRGDGMSTTTSQSCNASFRQAELIEPQEVCLVLSLGLNQHRKETFHRPRRALSQELLESVGVSILLLPSRRAAQTMTLRASSADEQPL